jgi:hypothetical protein
VAKKKRARGTSALEKTPSGRSAGPKGKRSDYPGVSFTPPKSVQAAARKGLKLREKMAKRRSRPGGTKIGVARARQLASGKAVWPRSVRRMKSYFARHRGDKKAKGWGSSTDPSPGYVAWLLWGGDAGDRWAKKTWAKMQKVKKNPEEDYDMAVEKLTIIEGPMDGLGENPGVGDWMRSNGISPGLVAFGGLAGAALCQDSSMLRGALRWAVLFGFGSWIYNRCSR